MAAMLKPHPRGWRRPVLANTILLALLTGALSLTTFFSGNEAESFTINHFFYAGACETTRTLNLVIHLGLNIVATLVFSSSIFAMQVLNSPTRAEVDAAHTKGKYVEIGVPSLSNLFALSKFKALAWVVLAVFSLPVHMLLNSAVFETDFHGKSWNLTIAAEPFVDSGEFFWPGASLAFPGFEEGYGRDVDFTEFLSNSSQALLELRTTASAAAMWTRLDSATCRREYLQCDQKQDFKDVVLVVNTAGDEDTDGWTRADVFDMGAEAADWDEIVPADELNSLWFAATCEMGMQPENGPDACTNSCGRVLGSRVSLGNDSEIDKITNPWVIPFQDRQIRETDIDSDLPREGFRFDQFNDLEVRYCLAEKSQQTCKLGVSPLMLGLAALCIAFIATQLLFVLRKLSDDLLVTPGDAIASFIADPNLVTEGMSTLSFEDKASPLSFLRRKRGSLSLSEPREWCRRRNHMGSSIPAVTWLITYLFLADALGTLAYSYFHFGIRAITDGSFAHHPDNGHMRSMDVPDGAFLLALLMANKTQVFLAACYYFYNGLLTRFAAEREWNAYSLAYQPLRVTQPKGSQTSTYRLQLPYKLGIPLTVIIALLHWTLSNTYYLSIFEGGYFGSDREGLRSVEDNLGFDANTIVALSYSVQALLILSIAAFLLVLVPVLVAFMKFRGDMVIAGANSRVISAACHPRLFVSSSSVSFKSPWSSGDKVGLMTTSPKSPRYSNDLRSSYRSRRTSDARSGEAGEWPLPSARASDMPPSPYVESPIDVGETYRERRSAEGTVRPLRPESQGFHLPSPSSKSSGARKTMHRPRTMSESSQWMMDEGETYRLRRSSEATARSLRPESQGFHLPSPSIPPGVRRTMHKPRTMSESSEWMPSHVTTPEGQRLMPPPSPYDPRSPREPTSYFPRTTSGFTERRPSDVSVHDTERLMPPSPYERPYADGHGQRAISESAESRRPLSARPPSEWGKMKFEPNHAHNVPPEITGLEPPSAPWLGTYKDDAMSPWAQPTQTMESTNRGTPLSIITPASSNRKLPWTAEPDPVSTPATPRVPSIAPQFLERDGAARAKALRKLAGRRLRWGAMPVLDRDSAAQVFPEKGTGVGRLAFGSVESGIAEPEVGRVYE